MSPVRPSSPVQSGITYIKPKTAKTAKGERPKPYQAESPMKQFIKDKESQMMSNMKASPVKPVQHKFKPSTPTGA
jgi:hypothetical protein